MERTTAFGRRGIRNKLLKTKKRKIKSRLKSCRELRHFPSHSPLKTSDGYKSLSCIRILLSVRSPNKLDDHELRVPLYCYCHCCCCCSCSVLMLIISQKQKGKLQRKHVLHKIANKATSRNQRTHQKQMSLLSPLEWT